MVCPISSYLEKTPGPQFNLSFPRADPSTPDRHLHLVPSQIAGSSYIQNNPALIEISFYNPIIEKIYPHISCIYIYIYRVYIYIIYIYICIHMIYWITCIYIYDIFATARTPWPGMDHVGHLQLA